MAHLPLAIFLVTAAAAMVLAAEESRLRRQATIRMLREMSSQTNGNSLDLPANSTSIRANITDTFSCKNRIYGYYADVDNDCQIFHVCQPSQTSSRRNTTYKWSFICPNETIFNQEVLVCTRSRDAAPCEEAPMYYDVNNDIGKVPNKTQSANGTKTHNTDATKVVVNRSRIKHINKGNLVLNPNENVKNTAKEEERIKSDTSDKITKANKDTATVNEMKPVIADVSDSEFSRDHIKVDSSAEINERIVAERSIAHNEKRNRRFGFRFKADVV